MSAFKSALLANEMKPLFRQIETGLPMHREGNSLPQPQDRLLRGAFLYSGLPPPAIKNVNNRRDKLCAACFACRTRPRPTTFSRMSTPFESVKTSRVADAPAHSREPTAQKKTKHNTRAASRTSEMKKNIQMMTNNFAGTKQREGDATEGFEHNVREIHHPKPSLRSFE